MKLPKWLRRMMVAFAALLLCFGVGFLFLPEIINGLDARFASAIDARLGTDQSVILKLDDPGYFAEQSEIISEKQETSACISSPERRIRITDLALLPDLFQQAIIASEDKTFLTNEGIDKWAIARAFIQQYILHVSTSGASTIEMQIAKELRRGVGRRSTGMEKIGDIITALRIKREFSKQQLMLKYVNMPYFGRGQYGIEAASRAYFGKPAKELALHQIAFIVSLINKPALPDRSFSSDRRAKTPEEIKSANWQESLRGSRRVLQQMLDNGFITDIEYARAADALHQDLHQEVLPRGKSCGANDYFLEHVRQKVIKLGFRLDRGGLTVPVTRDEGLEDMLNKAVKTTVDTYLARHQHDVDNDQLRAGAFAIEFTGDVLAEVGNIDFKKFKHDVITSGWRQPGSTFKIFTYGGLVERLTAEVLAGENPPETLDDIAAEVTKRCMVLDAPIGVSLGRGRGVKMIQNFRSNSEPLYRSLNGVPISCSLAVGESRNTAAIRAGQRAGIKHVIEMTYRLGMPKDPKHLLQPYPTTAIGASEVNPLGMASAIAFVNGGYKVTPRFVNDVCKDGKSRIFTEDTGQASECDKKGERRAPQERVMHPATSLVMTEVLKAPLDVFVLEKNKEGKVVQHHTGTARGLREGIIPGLDPLGSEVWKLTSAERKNRMLAFPLDTAGEIAGKTGTATNADGRTSDVWLILFIPGPPERPEKGVMLGFWMGKDSKDHPLGDRGTGTTKGFAESGGRNWTHSAALVLSFLQKERGLLKPGNRFQPIYRDDVLQGFDGKGFDGFSGNDLISPDEVRVVDPADPNTPPELLQLLPHPELEEKRNFWFNLEDPPEREFPD